MVEEQIVSTIRRERKDSLADTLFSEETADELEEAEFDHFIDYADHLEESVNMFFPNNVFVHKKVGSKKLSY